MKDRQRVHIGMVNSYNVLTRKARVIDVIESPIPIFAHIVDDVLQKSEIDLIIGYFEMIEEYEKCIELKCVSQTLFYDNGEPKEMKQCECLMPSYAPRYDDVMICCKCNNPIVYERV